MADVCYVCTYVSVLYFTRLFFFFCYFVSVPHSLLIAARSRSDVTEWLYRLAQLFLWLAKRMLTVFLLFFSCKK